MHIKDVRKRMSFYHIFSNHIIILSYIHHIFLDYKESCTFCPDGGTDGENSME